MIEASMINEHNGLKKINKIIQMMKWWNNTNESSLSEDLLLNCINDKAGNNPSLAVIFSWFCDLFIFFSDFFPAYFTSKETDHYKNMWCLEFPKFSVQSHITSYRGRSIIYQKIYATCKSRKKWIRPHTHTLRKYMNAAMIEQHVYLYKRHWHFAKQQPAKSYMFST